MRMLMPVPVIGVLLLGPPALADEPLTVTAATGPHATAFDDRCAELRARDPHVTCTRVRHLDASGLVYDLYKTTMTDRADPDRSGDALWVSIDTEVGWFTVREAFPLLMDGGNGTGSVQSSATLDAMTLRAVRLGGRRAALLEVRRTWTVDCIECAPRSTTRYREISVVACRVGPVGVDCGELVARGAAPRVAVHGDVLEVAGQLDEKSFAKGRYTHSPN